MRLSNNASSFLSELDNLKNRVNDFIDAQLDKYPKFSDPSSKLISTIHTGIMRIFGIKE